MSRKIALRSQRFYSVLVLDFGPGLDYLHYSLYKKYRRWGLVRGIFLTLEIIGE